MPYIRSRTLGCGELNSYNPDFGRITSGGGRQMGSVLDDAKSVGRQISGLFQSSDPQKDDQRKARAQQYFEAAANGDARAEADLRCMAGQLTAGATHVDSSGGCANAGGSKVGQAFAAALVHQLETLKNTGTFGPITTGAVKSAASSPIVWGLAGLAGLLWATSGSSSKPRTYSNPRRRRRR